MSENIDYEKFKIDVNFSCTKYSYPTPVGCKGCKYYYLNEERLSRCLKLNIRDWMKYRVEEDNNL